MQETTSSRLTTPPPSHDYTPHLKLTEPLDDCNRFR